MTNASRALPYSDDVETIPADEVNDIQRVVDALQLILARSRAKTGQFRSDVHVKTHGYAQGEFRVLPNLPEELAQGLFEHQHVYAAVARFSVLVSSGKFLVETPVGSRGAHSMLGRTQIVPLNGI
jgi:hypothetical protein